MSAAFHPPAPIDAPPRPAPPWRAIGVLTLVVLGWHGLLLQHVWPAGSAPAALRALQVRHWVVPARVAEAMPAPLSSPLPLPSPAPAPATKLPADATAASTMAAAARRPVAGAPLPSKPAATPLPTAPPAAAPSAAPFDASPSAAGPDALRSEFDIDSLPPAAASGIGGVEAAPPLYATRIPPPTSLRYAWQHGTQRGAADLVWQPSADEYLLELRLRAGTLARGSRSRGGFDAGGLAPVRLVDQHRGRDLRAVNFERDLGRISFSGPSHQAPLWPGSQDRLSWLVQLAAMLQADPGLAQPGTALRLAVAGTRGDAEVWTFNVVGSDTLAAPEGTVDGAVHLQRLPRRPYDQQIDIWLDPARQHWPVKLLLQPRPAAAARPATLWTLESLRAP